MIEASRKPSGVSPGGQEPFLALRENRVALAAVERLVAPARSTRPLVYLWGPSGSGKSHLARHFLRELRRTEASLRVACVTGSEFAAQLADASSLARVREFQERYRTLDAFVCEDIHVLGDRAETQRQLVIVLDELRDKGARVILTADRLPGEVSGFIARLVSRCHGGVTARMSLPGPASRAQLLTQFAASRQIAISPEAVQELAERRAVSPRELLGALNQLETTARVEKSRLDRDFVRRFLAGDVPEPEVSLNDIARAVARHFGVRISDLRSATRLQGLSVPRQCAMYLGRRLTGEPLARIATYFGRRNHSAVIHAVRRTKLSIGDEPVLRQHLAQIRSVLGARGEETEQE